MCKPKNSNIQLLLQYCIRWRVGRRIKRLPYVGPSVRLLGLLPVSSAYCLLRFHVRRKTAPPTASPAVALCVIAGFRTAVKVTVVFVRGSDNVHGPAGLLLVPRIVENDGEAVAGAGVLSIPGTELGEGGGRTFSGRLIPGVFPVSETRSVRSRRGEHLAVLSHGFAPGRVPCG